MTMSKIRWPMMLGALCAMWFAQPLQACDCDCDYDTGLSTNSWVKKFKISGDLRGRYQHDDNDNLSGSDGTSRDRLRIRARLGTHVALCEWATVDLRISTGSDDPNSNNQTLDSCFSKKNWNLDRAEATVWHPDFDWVQFHFGKIENPAWEPGFLSPLVWDTDITPEGFAATFDWELEDECWNLFGFASYYQIDEINSGSSTQREDDPWMMDFMLGARFNYDWVKGTLAAGYYFTEHVKNSQMSCDFADGNYTDSEGYYSMGNFGVFRVFGEAAFDIIEDEVLGTPGVLTISGGYVHNFDDDYDFAPKELTAYTAQVQFGKAKNPMTWEVAVQYKRQEANSAVDMFADSDWHNGGGTDAKGWVVAGKLAVCHWWTVGLKAFFTKRITDSNNYSHDNEHDGNNTRFTRIQVDSLWQF